MVNVEQRLTKARQERAGYPDWFEPAVADFVLSECVKKVNADAAKEVLLDCSLVTMMSAHAYRSFLLDNEYKSFWKTGPTWHHQYSADPSQGRLFNDMRLFGEKREDVTYALLVAPSLPYQIPYDAPDSLLDYLESYCEGHPKLIHWHHDLMETATFTYGDSQQNVIAFPAKPENFVAFTVAYAFTRWLTSGGIGMVPDFFQELHTACLLQWPPQTLAQSCFGSFLGAGNKMNPYYEVQIHGTVTTEDILHVV